MQINNENLSPLVKQMIELAKKKDHLTLQLTLAVSTEDWVSAKLIAKELQRAVRPQKLSERQD